MRDRGGARERRRGRGVRGIFLVGLVVVVAPLVATAAGASCASPGWLGIEAPAGAAADASLADRLTLSFDRACQQPFVIELELRLLAPGGDRPLVRRSAPREFRPGERFLPGESYLFSRAFPESAELLAELFERADCRPLRVAGSLRLRPTDPDPESGAHRAACILVIAAPAAGTDGETAASTARLALFLDGGAG